MKFTHIRLQLWAVSGVINAGFGYPGAIEKLGIERRVYTAGESKSLMDPFKPEVEKDVKLMKALLKEVHDFFKAFVKEARGDKLKGVQKTLFSGQVWNGEEGHKVRFDRWRWRYAKRHERQAW